MYLTHYGTMLTIYPHLTGIKMNEKEKKQYSQYLSSEEQVTSKISRLKKDLE